MNGQHVAYRRVSTELQNESRQLVGMTFDEEFTDKLSGKDKNRPQLNACMKHLRRGDTLNVHSIDRLARSLKDLNEIIHELTNKGVVIHFHKENLKFGDKADNEIAKACNELMLNILGSFSQFELAIINERRREGQAIAKKQGKHIGRKPILNESHINEIKNMWKSGKNKMQIAKELGISRPSLYKFIEKNTIKLKTQNI